MSITLANICREIKSECDELAVELDGDTDHYPPLIRNRIAELNRLVRKLADVVHRSEAAAAMMEGIASDKT